MHRTVMNMVRSMVFASDLFYFCFGVMLLSMQYVYQRSPTKENLKHVSPIEMGTNKSLLFNDIVAFGSPCTVYKDRRKVTWQTWRVALIIEKVIR